MEEGDLGKEVEEVLPPSSHLELCSAERGWRPKHGACTAQPPCQPLSTAHSHVSTPSAQGIGDNVHVTVNVPALTAGGAHPVRPRRAPPANLLHAMMMTEHSIVRRARVIVTEAAFLSGCVLLGVKAPCGSVCACAMEMRSGAPGKCDSTISSVSNHVTRKTIAVPQGIRNVSMVCKRGLGPENDLCGIRDLNL